MKKKCDNGIIYAWDYEHKHVDMCPICSCEFKEYEKKKQEAIESEFLTQIDCECGMKFQFLA